LILFCLPALGFTQTVRSIDGSFNNSLNPDWGAEGTELFQLTEPRFSDGISAMNGEDRPNPRLISNTLFSQEDNIFDEYLMAI